MPCTSDYSSGCDHEDYEGPFCELMKVAIRTVERLQPGVDGLSALMENGLKDREVQLWGAHQKADARRRREDRAREDRRALRQRALAKLSPAERRALKVNE